MARLGKLGLTLCGKSSPPALLIAANKDNLVDPVRNTGALAAAMRASGVPVREVYFDGVNHVTLLGSLSTTFKALAPTLDAAFAALVDDLHQSGRLDDTLVACIAEFGRTPKFNPGGGRDHWGSVFSVALAGGGIKGGMVYGASDAIGGQPKDGRVRPEDLTATILHCLGYSPETEYRDHLGRPHPASRGEVIRGIV